MVARRKAVYQQFDALMGEISMQRRLMEAEDLETFDTAWGLDPTGEFYTETRLVFF